MGREWRKIAIFSEGYKCEATAPPACRKVPLEIRYGSFFLFLVGGYRLIVLDSNNSSVHIKNKQ